MSLPLAVLPDAAAAVVPCPPRLLAVFGTPSAMTHWGIHLTRVILGVVEGEHGVVHGAFLADFAGLATGAHPACVHATVVCTSDCPGAGVQGFLADAAAPAVIFAEMPGDVIDDLVGGSGVDVVNALRLATRSLCALQPLMAPPGATVFRRAELAGTLAGFVDVLMAALRIAASPEQRATIDMHLGSREGETAADHLARMFPLYARRGRGGDAPAAGLDPAADASPDPSGTQAADLVVGTVPPADATTVGAVAGLYGSLAVGAAFDRAIWPASIFSSGDRIGDYLAGPCDMVGPARIMVYGPYMHLPPGEWSACVEMEVAGNMSGNRLKVDLIHGPLTLVSASADMPVLGQYAFALPFRVVEALEPLELRFQIESGAIEGRFLLRSVVMTRRTPA